MISKWQYQRVYIVRIAVANSILILSTQQALSVRVAVVRVAASVIPSNTAKEKSKLRKAVDIMTDRESSLLGKFFDNLSYSPHKERMSSFDSMYFGNSPYTYTIKFEPKKIESRCGREVINFVMQNLVFTDELKRKGKFFGYKVKISGYDDYENGSGIIDYFKVTMSETGYKSLEEEMYNTDDDDDD